MHHCNNQQQNSGISDTPSIDTRRDMSSAVLFCMAFFVICAAMPGESAVLPGQPFETEREIGHWSHGEF